MPARYEYAFGTLKRYSDKIRIRRTYQSVEQLQKAKLPPQNQYRRRVGPWERIES